MNGINSSDGHKTGIWDAGTLRSSTQDIIKRTFNLRDTCSAACSCCRTLDWPKNTGLRGFCFGPRKRPLVQMDLLEVMEENINKNRGEKSGVE